MGHAAAAVELEADAPQAMQQALLGPGFNVLMMGVRWMRRQGGRRSTR